MAWWLFPHHLCGSLLLLRCLQRGVWVLTAIYWISLKPLPPTTITGHLLGAARMSCAPPQMGHSVTGQEGVDKNHSTSCLFLQRFVESEREFLNSLFLTIRSTFELHGILLSESLLVASSILCIPFFSRVHAFYSSARVPHLHCNCHHDSNGSWNQPAVKSCWSTVQWPKFMPLEVNSGIETFFAGIWLPPLWIYNIAIFMHSLLYKGLIGYEIVLWYYIHVTHTKFLDKLCNLLVLLNIQQT